MDSLEASTDTPVNESGTREPMGNEVPTKSTTSGSGDVLAVPVTGTAEAGAWHDKAADERERLFNMSNWLAAHSVTFSSFGNAPKETLRALTGGAILARRMSDPAVWDEVASIIGGAGTPHERADAVFLLLLTKDNSTRGTENDRAWTPQRIADEGLDVGVSCPVCKSYRVTAGGFAGAPDRDLHRAFREGQIRCHTCHTQANHMDIRKIDPVSDKRIVLAEWNE